MAFFYFIFCCCCWWWCLSSTYEEIFRPWNMSRGWVDDTSITKGWWGGCAELLFVAFKALGKLVEIVGREAHTDRARRRERGGWRKWGDEGSEQKERGDKERGRKRKKGREKKERKRKPRKRRKKKGRRRGRRGGGVMEEGKKGDTQIHKGEANREIWKEIPERERGGGHTHTYTDTPECVHTHTHTCVSEWTGVTSGLEFSSCQNLEKSWIRT